VTFGLPKRSMTKLIFQNITYKFLAALVMGCFFLAACENDPEVIKAWTERKTLVEVGKSIESYLSQGGQMRAKLVSPIMYRYETDTVYTEFPKTLHVDFYDDSVNVESRLDAMYGKYYESLNKVYLRDSVRVINVNGDTLRCPDLWWDQNLQKFYTDKPARLDGKDKHIVGNQGLEATQDLKVIQFRYPTGPFQVKEGTMPK
jgi:LPS export ABC transporter protein LptC